jgi:hypothetical protein
MSNCNICYERYNKEVNPPLTCNPCGHGLCEPCLNAWRRTNSSNRNTCPQCRQIVISTIVNRDLMDMIESNNVLPSTTNPLFKFKNIENRKINEVIIDKSRYAVYIIDNSGSMGNTDGKIVIKNNKSFTILEGVSRWNEAEYKIIEIANYNIKRNMVATYYLLNPLGNKWKDGLDYITIDPNNKEDVSKKLNILKNTILDMNNIRGNTPLDVITKKIRQSLHNFVNDSNYKSMPICYNIITDGDPNNKNLFEYELKKLSNNYNIFLTVNLCTDNDNTIEYYNDLDKKIGNELGGLDVIDDIKGEQLEIMKAGNNFFTYSNDIHICRMAGCNFFVADLLDEEKLSIHHATTLVKQLLNNPDDIPHWTDRKNYIKTISKLNKSVYNLYYKCNTDLININNVDWMIWRYQLKKQIQSYNENYIWIIMITLFFLFISIISS